MGFIDGKALDNSPSMSDLTSNSICIKKCPSSENDKIECYPTTKFSNCNDLQAYNTFGLFERICIPSAKELSQLVLKNVDLTYLQEAIDEIKIAWPAYIITFFISLIVCVVFYFLLQCCAGL